MKKDTTIIQLSKDKQAVILSDVETNISCYIPKKQLKAMIVMASNNPRRFHKYIQKENSNEN